MTWPTVAIVTTNLDAGTDSPASARTDLLDAVTKENQMIAHVSAYAATLLDDASAAIARATLGVAPRSTRLDVNSVAGTVDLTANAPDCDDINMLLALTVTAFTIAAGRVVRVRANAAHTLTNNASIVTNTGANIVCAAGDTYVLRATAANTVEVLFYSPATPVPQIQRIDATVAASALTISLYPTELDFRQGGSTGSGVTYRRKVASTISLTVPAGASLGTYSGYQSRLAVLAIDNAGTVELAVCNIAYNSVLDESIYRNTVAISSGSTSGTVIYSTTARSGVAFRLVGYVDSTQTAAGTWASAPYLIQGSGGNAAVAHGSLGFGVTWTSVTRTAGSTYVNDTGRPILLHIMGVHSVSFAYVYATIGGVNLYGPATASGTMHGCGPFLITPGVAYSWNVSSGALSSVATYELR